MGLAHTGDALGFYWLRPKINWETLTLRPDVTRRIFYNNTMLWDTFRRQWPRVVDFKTDLARLEMIGHWLEVYPAPSLRNFLLEYLTALLFRTFRKDVFSSILNDIRPECVEDALAGKYSLCQKTLWRILIPERIDPDNPPDPASHRDVYIVAADRTRFAGPKDLVDFLWDDDGRERKQWADRAFRALYRQALELVLASCGREGQQAFCDRFKRLFIATNWTLPLPSPKVLTQKNSARRRKWLSILHEDVAYSAELNIRQGSFRVSVLAAHLRDRVDSSSDSDLDADVPPQEKPCPPLAYMYKWHLVQSRYGCCMRPAVRLSNMIRSSTRGLPK